MKNIVIMRSLQIRMGLCYCPGTTSITITLTQIMQLRTLSKALLVHSFIALNCISLHWIVFSIHYFSFFSIHFLIFGVGGHNIQISLSYIYLGFFGGGRDNFVCDIFVNFFHFVKNLKIKCCWCFLIFGVGRGFLKMWFLKIRFWLFFVKLRRSKTTEVFWGVVLLFWGWVPLSHLFCTNLLVRV